MAAPLATCEKRRLCDPAKEADQRAERAIGQLLALLSTAGGWCAILSRKRSRSWERRRVSARGARKKRENWEGSFGVAIEWDGTQNRRLPVYLLLDCSSSMAGVKIQQVNTGVQMLYQELMADPRSADTVYISIIPFASSAYQMDLVPIAQFTPPQLTANGQTALGSALSLLNQSLDSDLIINQPGKKGDYKPLVFILTDGQPTDTWDAEAQKLRARTTAANIIALGIGHDADDQVLQAVAGTVLKMENVTGDNLRAFFQWVSQSVQTASKAAQGQAQAAQLPPPPPGITVEL